MSEPPDAAVAAALRGLLRDAADASAWDALGVALARAGEHQEARTALAEALRLDPSDLGRGLRLADAAAAAGQAEAEIARQRALDPEGESAARLLVRAHLLRRLGREADGARLAERATALAPDAAEPAAELGRLLLAGGHEDAALTALRRAAERAPQDLALHETLGRLLLRIIRPAEAEHHLLIAVGPDEADPEMLVALALARLQLGLQDAARQTAERAIAHGAEPANAHRALASIVAYCDGVSGAELSDVQRSCGALWPREPPARFANVPDPARRLRLGLLAASLHRHPVAWLTLAGLEALDRDGFAIECFAGPGPADRYTARYRAIATAWHDTGGLDDAVLARLIRARGIDVLIDLGGYLRGGRLPVLARRPAPVQVKWAGGQFHTTGIAEVDWFLTDALECPPDLAHLYTERLLTFPGTYACYDPPADAPPLAALPALGRGFVTFGSFNNLMKLTTRVISTWAAILHRVPSSRLLIATPQFTEAVTAARIRAAFRAAGISADRLDLLGAMPPVQLLERYNSVDLALQTFPYGGCVTVLEGLWMGVPSIARDGESFAARHALSFLSAVRLADFVAATPDEYIALAIAKASDLDALAILRAELRQRVAASALCDRAGFGRALGSALRAAWADWCAAGQDACPSGAPVQ